MESTLDPNSLSSRAERKNQSLAENKKEIQSVASAGQLQYCKLGSKVEEIKQTNKKHRIRRKSNSWTTL